MHSRTGLSRSAFTLIELLVVIAIIAILSVVVILSLNPAELLRQSRDSTRLSDMDTMNHALSLYAADQGGNASFNLGSAKTVYVSLPDSSSTCGDLGLPTLPSGYTYACVGSTSSKNINGTGWIPVNLSNISSGSPLGSLPLDPVNQSSSRLYYTYTTNGSQYELTSALESQKYKLGGSNDVISTDGGTLASVYEKGSKLGLEPLDYGDASLVGLWTFDEGNGSTTYDYSGNNATGSWQGTLGSQWTSGKVGPYAGQFNGTNNYINVPASNILNLPSALTVTAWVYPTNTSTFAVVSNNWGGSNVSILLTIGGGVAILNTYNGTVVYASTTGINLNQWNFVVGTYDKNAGTGNVKVYINAGTPGTNTQTGNLNGNAQSFQFGEQEGLEYMNGDIDDVRVYNRALTASQVAALYNGGK